MNDDLHPSYSPRLDWGLPRFLGVQKWQFHWSKVLEKSLYCTYSCLLRAFSSIYSPSKPTAQLFETPHKHVWNSSSFMFFILLLKNRSTNLWSIEKNISFQLLPFLHTSYLLVVNNQIKSYHIQTISLFINWNGTKHFNFVLAIMIDESLPQLMYFQKMLM